MPVVKSVSGEVLAIAQNGEARLLVAGDDIGQDVQLVSTAGLSKIEFNGAPSIEVGQSPVSLASENTLASAQNDAKAIQQGLLNGENLSQLDDTAAGGENGVSLSPASFAAAGHESNVNSDTLASATNGAGNGNGAEANLGANAFTGTVDTTAPAISASLSAPSGVLNQNSSSVLVNLDISGLGQGERVINGELVIKDANGNELGMVSVDDIAQNGSITKELPIDLFTGGKNVDGKFVIEFEGTAIDGAGNTSPVNANTSVSIDNTPSDADYNIKLSDNDIVASDIKEDSPDITATVKSDSLGAGDVLTGKAVLIDENKNEIDLGEVRLTNQNPSAVFVLPKDKLAGKDGVKYEVKIKDAQVVDSAGNSATPKGNEATMDVDTKAPNIDLKFVLVEPSKGVSKETNELKFQLVGKDDNKPLKEVLGDNVLKTAGGNLKAIFNGKEYSVDENGFVTVPKADLANLNGTPEISIAPDSSVFDPKENKGELSVDNASVSVKPSIILDEFSTPKFEKASDSDAQVQDGTDKTISGLNGEKISLSGSTYGLADGTALTVKIGDVKIGTVTVNDNKFNADISLDEDKIKELGQGDKQLSLFVDDTTSNAQDVKIDTIDPDIKAEFKPGSGASLKSLDENTGELVATNKTINEELIITIKDASLSKEEILAQNEGKLEAIAGEDNEFKYIGELNEGENYISIKADDGLNHSITKFVKIVKDTSAPDKPSIEDDAFGNVSIAPNSTKMQVAFTNENGGKVLLTIFKEEGSWKLNAKAGTDLSHISLDEKTGKLTLGYNATVDGTKVYAASFDENGNNSEVADTDAPNDPRVSISSYGDTDKNGTLEYSEHKNGITVSGEAPAGAKVLLTDKHNNPVELVAMKGVTTREINGKTYYEVEVGQDGNWRVNLSKDAVLGIKDGLKAVLSEADRSDYKGDNHPAVAEQDISIKAYAPAVDDVKNSQNESILNLKTNDTKPDLSISGARAGSEVDVYFVKGNEYFKVTGRADESGNLNIADSIYKNGGLADGKYKVVAVDAGTDASKIAELAKAKDVKSFSVDTKSDYELDKQGVVEAESYISAKGHQVGEKVDVYILYNTNKFTKLGEYKVEADSSNNPIVKVNFDGISMKENSITLTPESVLNVKLVSPNSQQSQEAIKAELIKTHQDHKDTKPEFNTSFEFKAKKIGTDANDLSAEYLQNHLKINGKPASELGKVSLVEGDTYKFEFNSKDAQKIVYDPSQTNQKPHQYELSLSDNDGNVAKAYTGYEDFVQSYSPAHSYGLEAHLFALNDNVLIFDNTKLANEMSGSGAELWLRQMNFGFAFRDGSESAQNLKTLMSTFDTSYLNSLKNKPGADAAGSVATFAGGEFKDEKGNIIKLEDRHPSNGDLKQGTVAGMRIEGYFALNSESGHKIKGIDIDSNLSGDMRVVLKIDDKLVVNAFNGKDISDKNFALDDGLHKIEAYVAFKNSDNSGKAVNFEFNLIDDAGNKHIIGFNEGGVDTSSVFTTKGGEALKGYEAYVKEQGGEFLGFRKTSSGGAEAQAKLPDSQGGDDEPKARESMDTLPNDNNSGEHSDLIPFDKIVNDIADQDKSAHNTELPNNLPSKGDVLFDGEIEEITSGTEKAEVVSRPTLPDNVTIDTLSTSPKIIPVDENHTL